MNFTLAWARIFPSSEPEGWTITSIERESRYWATAKVGRKDESLFETGVQATWQWAQSSLYAGERDGEPRYAQQLWKLASVWLKRQATSRVYYYRKVWRYGLEVACKIKASQAKRRVESVKPEHPFTAISASSEVHANHNEALNSAIPRRCSAYRRRQNHYAKTVDGLQHAITAQRLIHNWSSPHWSLEQGTTPAMAIGFCARPIPIEEFLTLRGYAAITN
jgi:hypothetical protein